MRQADEGIQAEIAALRIAKANRTISERQSYYLKALEREQRVRAVQS
jgi:hypothetical protein